MDKQQDIGQHSQPAEQTQPGEKDNSQRRRTQLAKPSVYPIYSWPEGVGDRHPINRICHSRTLVYISGMATSYVSVASSKNLLERSLRA